MNIEMIFVTFDSFIILFVAALVGRLLMRKTRFKKLENQFLDCNGDPLSNGKILSGDIEIKLDSDGCAGQYVLTDDANKVQVYDRHDNLIFSVN